MEEVAQEIIEENSIPPPIEEYCTEYDGNFHYPNYDPNKKKERDEEVRQLLPINTFLNKYVTDEYFHKKM